MQNHKLHPTLPPSHQALHDQAVELCREHRKLESEIIKVLEKIDRTDLYKTLGYSTLYKYSVDCLGLSEGVAYAFVSVMRTGVKSRPLQESLSHLRLSVAKASRIVSVINPENAPRLVQFAETHTMREIDFEVARINPKARAPDKATPLTEDLVKFQTSLARTTFEKLKRVQSLQSKSSGFDQILELVLEEYLERHDPVRKAKRFHERRHKIQSKPPMRNSGSGHESTHTSNMDSTKTPDIEKTTDIDFTHSVSVRTETCKTPTESAVHGKNNARASITSIQNPKGASKYRRAPLNAATKHRVYRRDQGQCTHSNSDGQRCLERRWVQLHHIKLKSEGGSDHPDNLTTLCSFHHQAIHGKYQHHI